MSNFTVSIKATHMSITAKDDIEAEEKGVERLIQLIKIGAIDFEVKKS